MTQVGGAEAGADYAPASRSSSPSWMLQIAREYDRKGHIHETIGAYEAAIKAAALTGDAATEAEALRRLAVVRHRCQESGEARALCERSRAVAGAIGHADLVAEALNTAGGLELVDERLDLARSFFLQASVVAAHPDLQGRIEQNLGTIAGLQGRHADALERYRRSLAGFLLARNEQGCAVAYHNLGVISMDLRQWDQADQHLRSCLRTVQATGDQHLRGLALLNHAEVLIILDRAREARIAAETAAGIFDEMHAPRELADAYRVLGCVHRKEGELSRAQARLRMAIEVASTSRCEASEAEATRDLALVLAAQGRREEALALMRQATAELERHKPAVAAGRILCGHYPASLRAWSELLSVGGPAPLAHAERVARVAADVARLLGYDDEGQARVYVTGCLHELDPDELGDGTLPWDVRPTLRALREWRGGGGEPLGLMGDRIPLEAEIVGIADAHDGSEMPSAVERYWRPPVVAAFHRSSAGVTLSETKGT